MSDHTICDKCMKVIDKETEPYLQVIVTEVTPSDLSAPMQPVGNTATYDYHPEHAPKFEKGQPAEPEPT